MNRLDYYNWTVIGLMIVQLSVQLISLWLK